MEIKHPPVFSLNSARIASLVQRSDCHYCRQVMPEADVSFSERKLRSGEYLPLGHRRNAEMLFLLSGRLRFGGPGEYSGSLLQGQIVLVPRKAQSMATAAVESQLIRLSFNNRICQCDRDLMAVFRRRASGGDRLGMVQLGIHPVIGLFLKSLLNAGRLLECPCYHQLKQKELFLLMVSLYGNDELARFFAPLARVRDDFEAFVLSNACRVATVGEFASLAGMSLSVFKREFERHFHESVYHWMMKHKAEKIKALLESGEAPVKEIMEGFGFKYYSHFSRFCKQWIGVLPSTMKNDLSDGKSNGYNPIFRGGRNE